MMRVSSPSPLETLVSGHKNSAVLPRETGEHIGEGFPPAELQPAPASGREKRRLSPLESH